MLMKRKEFVDALQEKTELVTGHRWNKEDCDALITIFTETVMDCLCEGKSPNIMGFGHFEVIDRLPHKTRHPVTKELIENPPTKTPVFRVGEEMRRRVKGVKKDG